MLLHVKVEPLTSVLSPWPRGEAATDNAHDNYLWRVVRPEKN